MIQIYDSFLAYNDQNYARYLTFFSIHMSDVDENHPGAEELLKKESFIADRSFIPANRCTVDKTIEEKRQIKRWLYERKCFRYQQ